MQTIETSFNQINIPDFMRNFQKFFPNYNQQSLTSPINTTGGAQPYRRPYPHSPYPHSPYPHSPYPHSPYPHSPYPSPYPSHYPPPYHPSPYYRQPSQQTQKDNSNIGYYITLELELHPGTSISPGDLKKAQCRQKWNSIRKSYSKLSGKPYMIQPVYNNNSQNKSALQNTTTKNNNRNSQNRTVKNNNRYNQNGMQYRGGNYNGGNKTRKIKRKKGNKTRKIKRKKGNK
jgi:hypothetical protein